MEKEEEAIGKHVVDAAIEIHRILGPGLLESVYEVLMCDELERRGFHPERQVPIPIHYKRRLFKEGFRADVIVNQKVILELKSVESMERVHGKQLLTYLKHSGLKLGYLLNFGAALMKNGVIRVINGLEDESLGVLGPSGEAFPRRRKERF
ncbi:MAG: GxxExxY protein [Opitutales bacterium]